MRERESYEADEDLKEGGKRLYKRYERTDKRRKLIKKSEMHNVEEGEKKEVI